MNRGVDGFPFLMFLTRADMKLNVDSSKFTRHSEGSSSEDDGKRETNVGQKKKNVMCDPKVNNKEEPTSHQTYRGDV